MKLFAVIPVLLLTSYCAPAQITTGSLVVAKVSNGKLIVAADSYGDIDKLNGVNDSKYDQCKIAVFRHEIVFASTGAVEATVFPLESWKNSDAARHAVASADLSLALVSQPRIEVVADQWANEVGMHWAELDAYDDHLVRSQVGRWGSNILTTGYFAMVNAGVLYQLFVNVVYDGENNPHITTERGGQLSKCTTDFCAFGAIDAFNQLRSTVTPRSKLKKWRPANLLTNHVDGDTLWIMHLTDLAIAREKPGKIGPPVDALELRGDGTVRWIARKPGCRDNDD